MYIASKSKPSTACGERCATEDGATTAYGNALANDSDPEGRALRVTNSGTYTGAADTLTLGGDGAYSYVNQRGHPLVGLTYQGSRPDEGEFLDVFELPLAEAITWVRQGRIDDSKTIVGLF